MNLKQRLASYVAAFNLNDEACHLIDISNEQAFAFLSEEIPLVDLPDKTIERTYYFRWWTYRKHIRKTPVGYIITEFLPDVPWAGPYNSINCSTPFHLREGRWLKNSKTYLRDYANFFLGGHGPAFAYSMCFVNALWEYARISGDTQFLVERYEQIRAWFDKRAELSATQWGLFYSVDDRDGMEYSISGSGLRPTINSYIYADAAACAKIAQLAGETEDAERYAAFAAGLKERINRYLFDGSFYRTIPAGEEAAVIQSGRKVSAAHDCKELVGYIPWMYGLADAGKNHAWKHLFEETCFAAPYGLTTADRSHSRFMEANEHECLWNGPVWPFAVSQVLAALRETLHGRAAPVTNEQYCALLHQYAACHRRTRQDGRIVDWIDENMDPFTGEWLARRILEAQGFQKETGGYERGKDYNHSLFCDLVLSGLLGIGEEAGHLTVDPRLPASWEHFAVENLSFHGKTYNIYYDRTGSVYGKGTGITIFPEGGHVYRV